MWGGLNTYAYAGDDPVDKGDATGLQAVVGTPYPGINTVICDGTGVPLPQLQQLTPLAEKCVSDCLLVHENSHIDDIISKYGPIGVCRGQSHGVIVQLPISQALQSERKAYAAELACLRAKLAKLACDDECRKMVTSRIQQISPYVTNPPGFGGK